MAVKIFLIGRPGSGKSEAARHIMRFAQSQSIPVSNVNDYDILNEKFMLDRKRKQFQPVFEDKNRQFRHPDDIISGFEVTDFRVLDTALKEVAKCVEEKVDTTRLIIVEFARKGYKEAFQENFTSELLEDAYFFYIEANVDICVRRVSKRSVHLGISEHHIVPEPILRGYYQIDNRKYMTSQFAADCNVHPAHIKIIVNEGSLREFKEKVQENIVTVFASEKELLPDTEKIQVAITVQKEQKQSMEQL